MLICTLYFLSVVKLDETMRYKKDLALTLLLMPTTPPPLPRGADHYTQALATSLSLEWKGSLSFLCGPLLILLAWSFQGEEEWVS